MAEVTSDESKQLAQAWKDVSPLVILDLAKMVKLGCTPAQILAEAVLKRTGKGKNG